MLSLVVGTWLILGAATAWVYATTWPKSVGIGPMIPAVVLCLLAGPVGLFFAFRLFSKREGMSKEFTTAVDNCIARDDCTDCLTENNGECPVMKAKK